jgi:rod shape-determining protein MreB
MSAQTPLYVGMDLGTFNTSVAGSNGYRDVMPTAVGWPRDHTRLGSDFVLGKDLVEHRSALDVVRPFEKGALKYVDAAAGMTEKQVERHVLATRLVIKYAVAAVRPERGRPVYGVIGVPSRAGLRNKKFIVDAARDAFDGVAIVSTPFAIAYGMNRLSDSLVIDVGAGTIDVCPIYGVYPSEEEQVTLPLGGDAVDEELEKRLRAKYPGVQVSRRVVRDLRERHGFVGEADGEAVVTLPVNGKPTALEVTEPLTAACLSIVGPIVEAVRGLVERFDPEFRRRLRNNVILGGGGSQLRGLDRAIERSMKEYGGARVTRVSDATYAGAVGALELATGMPAHGWTALTGEPGARKAAAAA